MLDAGSSVLFGAYLAGLSVAYISKPVSDNPPSPGSEESDTDEPYFEGVYGRTIGQLQGMLLAPLFFASIGYAIVCCYYRYRFSNYTSANDLIRSHSYLFGNLL